MRRRSQGFTLVELLVVLGIIGVLLGLLLAGVQKARAAAARIDCANNLRQLGLALHGYHDATGSLPPGVRRSPDPFPYLTWQARLLPYLEQEALWAQAEQEFKNDPRFWGPPRHKTGAVVVKSFICPADGRTQAIVPDDGAVMAVTHYLGVSGRNAATRDGLLYLDSRVRLADITDGTSVTLAAGERPPSSDQYFGWWYAGAGQTLNGNADSVLGVADFRTTFRTPTCPIGPYSFGPGDSSNPCDTFHFWSRHSGGAHFLAADGSLHFLPYAAAALLPALASRSGHEAAQLPD